MQDKNHLHASSDCALNDGSKSVNQKISHCLIDYISDILDIPRGIGTKIVAYASGKLIGLVGKIGVGKTLVQTFLEDIGFTSYAFAEPIKKMAAAIGFHHHELYGTQKQKLQVNSFWGISARRFLQTFGTEICRDELPRVLPEMENIWMRCFQKFRTDHWFEDIVVGDVRFLNEASAVKELGGFLIRLERPTLAEGLTASHASERELEQIRCNWIVQNNTTRLDVLRKVQTLICEVYSSNIK